MAFLTTKQVLDKFFNRTRDNSATLRVKALGWLHCLMTDVVNERPWLFLDRKVTLPITTNQISLPVDFSLESSIQLANQLLTPNEKLTVELAYLSDQGGLRGITDGYTVESTTITFHPGATGNAVLSYAAQMPVDEYADDNTPTIFPSEFVPLFERSLQTAFYEYDVDMDRLPLGLSVDKAQMSRMKKLDNSRKALPKANHRGYLRERP